MSVNTKNQEESMALAIWSIFTAVLTRLLFTVHSFTFIWRLTDTTEDSRYWYMAFLLLLILFEAIYIVRRRQGHEWKW